MIPVGKTNKNRRARNVVQTSPLEALARLDSVHLHPTTTRKKQKGASFDGEEGNLRGDFRSPFDRDVALELHSKKTRRKTIGWGLGMGMDNCACVGEASIYHGRGWECA